MFWLTVIQKTDLPKRLMMINIPFPAGFIFQLFKFYKKKQNIVPFQDQFPPVCGFCPFSNSRIWPAALTITRGCTEARTTTTHICKVSENSILPFKCFRFFCFVFFYCVKPPRLGAAAWGLWGRWWGNGAFRSASSVCRYAPRSTSKRCWRWTSAWPHIGVSWAGDMVFMANRCFASVKAATCTGKRKRFKILKCFFYSPQ